MAQNLKIIALNYMLNEKTKNADPETRDFKVFFDLVNGDTVSANWRDVLVNNDEASIKLKNAETDEAYFLEYVLFTDKIVGIYTQLDVDEEYEDSDEDEEDEDEDEDEIEFDNV